MRKELLAALAAIALVATPVTASDLDTIAKATFKLSKDTDGTCSMTLVKNKDKDILFLSAGHCTWSDVDSLNTRVQVLDPKNLRDVLSEQVIYLKPVKTLKQKDIVLLKPKDENIKLAQKPVDVASIDEAKLMKLGDDLMAVGYPAAEVLAVTKGQFTGKVPNKFPSELDKDVPMYQTTVPLAGGNSGGGLYAQLPVADKPDVKVWKLVGTATGRRVDNDIMTYWQTTETIHDALKGFVTSGSKTVIDTKAIQSSPLSIDQR